MVVCFCSLGFAPPRTSSALFHLARRAKYKYPPFLLVACQSQAWSSVSKPNTRNATLDFKIAPQEMIEPVRGEIEQKIETTINEVQNVCFSVGHSLISLAPFLWKNITKEIDYSVK